MQARYPTVTPANKKYLGHYYSDDCFQDIRRIVESIRVYILGYHSEYFMEGRGELHALRTERYTSEVETMKAQLQKPKYRLDSWESVLAICGSQQMEQVGAEDADSRFLIANII